MSKAFSGLPAMALGFASHGTDSETETKNPRNPKLFCGGVSCVLWVLRQFEPK